MEKTVGELAGAYLHVWEMLNNPDDEEPIDDEALNDTLDSIDDAIEVKADGYKAVIDNLAIKSAAKQGEIDQALRFVDLLKRQKTALENNQKRLRTNLQISMEQLGRSKFRTDNHTYYLQTTYSVKTPQDAAKLPPEYVNEKVTRTPNKKLLLKALKDDVDVPNVELVGTTSLRIR